MSGTLPRRPSLVVAGLGLLRAFAPVLILRRQLAEVDIGLVWVCVVTGLILICLPWLIMILATVLTSVRRFGLRPGIRSGLANG